MRSFVWEGGGESFSGTWAEEEGQQGAFSASLSLRISPQHLAPESIGKSNDRDLDKNNTHTVQVASQETEQMCVFGVTDMPPSRPPISPTPKPDAS